MGFDADFAAADVMFAEAFGVTVTYARGAGTVSLTAVVDTDAFEATGDESARTIGRPRAFWIVVADLEISGSPIEPRNGDLIKQTIDGTVEVFEVMPHGDGPIAKKLDPDWTEWLVFTKYMGPE